MASKARTSLFYIVTKKFPSLFQHNNGSKFQCETCELAKHHRVSFPLSSNKSSAPFSLIHTGVQGPSRVVSLNGCRWFISFIDDFSRTTWVYLLKDKSDVFTVFQLFHKMVQTQFNTSIKTICSDNGGEYMSGTLQKYFHAHGIIHKPLVLIPLNKMGLLNEKIDISQKSHGIFSLLPMFKVLLGSYLAHCNLSINRMPSRNLDFKRALEVLFSYVPSSNFIIPPHVFGCICFVHLHGQSRSKLNPHALKCVFIGHSPTQKGYKCSVDTRYKPPIIHMQGRKSKKKTAQPVALWMEPASNRA